MTAKERATSVVRCVFLCCLAAHGSACVEPPAARQQRVEFRAGSSPPARADYVQLGSSPADPSPKPATTPAPVASGGSAAAGTAGRGAIASSAGASASPAAGRAAPIGAAGSAATAEPSNDPVAPTGPATGLLTVKLTSVDQRGRYSPRNCGAVWIETKAGAFVKTMERWCGIRAYYLQRWTKASGGWGGGRGGFFGGGSSGMPNTADMMDAVTAATLRSHVVHESTWKLQDTKQELVPDGDYKVVVEVSDGSPHAVEFPFTKGREAVHLSPPDASPLTGVTIEYQPQAAP